MPGWQSSSCWPQTSPGCPPPSPPLDPLPLPPLQFALEDTHQILVGGSSLGFPPQISSGITNVCVAVTNHMSAAFPDSRNFSKHSFGMRGGRWGAQQMASHLILEGACRGVRGDD